MARAGHGRELKGSNNSGAHREAYSQAALVDDLYAGRHRELLAATVDSRDGYDGAAGLPYVVGCLVFKGRLFEAEAWTNRFAGQLCRDELAMAWFFLALGYTRHSRYGDARATIGRLWRLSRQAPSELTSYCLYQSLGFYRYFCGRYGNVARYSAKAVGIAALSRFQYGKYLALDLLGHAEVQGGEIGSGLGHLRDALSLAAQFGDGGSVTALEAVVAVYEVRFGLAEADRLERACTNAAGLDEDTYSRALIALETVRHFILKGRYGDAEQLLLEAWTTVKRDRHRRLDVWTQIVYAELCYRRGDLKQGLGYVAGAVGGLDPDVDLSLRIAAMDLDYKLRVALGEAVAARASLEQLLGLTQRQGSLLGRRRADRSAGRVNQTCSVPEDRIGRMLDLVHAASTPVATKVRALRDAGLLGLLPQALGLPPGRETLIVDAEAGTLTVVGRDGVHLAPVGLTAQVEALLSALASGVTTRAGLVERVWGYAYHPLRHDDVLYQLVARARRLLGPFGHWLATIPSGYQLQAVVVFMQRPELPLPVAPAVGTGEPKLRPRERRVIDLARELGEIDAALCRERLGLSRASASRDLKVLTDQGFLRRTGAGKATRYTCL